MKSVVGKKINFPKPYKSNLEIENNFDTKYKQNLLKIIKIINGKK